MSEYQYYEFQAIDRPLGEADRKALRDISSRARITATSFVNTYQWGDLKADPTDLVARWFDLHLYLANWGSRRLMIRVPARLIDRDHVRAFLGNVDCVQLQDAGENLVIDVGRDELEFEDWDEGSGWLAALAPLRAELLSGDKRLFYLLWLTAVEYEAVDADEAEPMPGIGPMTGALEAFADFFDIDPDLVQAAAERSAAAPEDELSDAARRVVATMPDGEKTALLVRSLDGDPHVGAELRARVRKDLEHGTAGTAPAPRTVGELRTRARAIGLAREQAAAEQAAEARRRRAEAAEVDRQPRLVAIRRRGETVWREVEDEIERRNATSYDKAAGLLSDLKMLAEQQGTPEVFLARLRAIRERHVRKGRFVDRLAAIGS